MLQCFVRFLRLPRGVPSQGWRRVLLRQLYAPYNLALRDLLRQDGASCAEAECDAFLWDSS